MANALSESYARGAKMTKKNGENSGGKKLKRLVIEETDNGGFIVECDWETKPKSKGKETNAPSYPLFESTKKAFSSWDETSEFLDDLYGE